MKIRLFRMPPESLVSSYGCRISATFHDEKDGSVRTVQVPVGQSLMEAAHAHDIDLEGELDIAYCWEAVNVGHWSNIVHVQGLMTALWSSHLWPCTMPL